MKLFDVYPLFDVNIVKGKGCIRSRLRKAALSAAPSMWATLASELNSSKTRSRQNFRMPALSGSIRIQ